MKPVFTLLSISRLAVIATICGFPVSVVASPECYMFQEGEIVDLSHMCGREVVPNEERAPVRPRGEEDFIRGLELYDNGSMEEALQSLDRAIEAEPEQVGYYWLRSLVHTESGNSGRAAVADFEALRRIYRHANRNNPAAMSDSELRQFFFPPQDR